MKKYMLLTAFITLFMSIALFTGCASNIDKGLHYNYILVHGATGGGWDWKHVEKLLIADNHSVYRPTLTGLGEKVHLANSDINLTTHINDIVNLILFEELDNVILVGHSYGGMVITGVMDRIPERIAYVIFLDAAVPDDGMSELDTNGPLPSNFKVIDGLVYPPWIDSKKPYPREVPQSLKTFTEPVSFKNPEAKKLPVTFVAYVLPDEIIERKEEDSSWKRAEERGWEIITFNSDHNAQRSHPAELVELLKATPKL